MKSRMLWNTGSPAFAGDDGAGRCHPHHAKGKRVPGWVEHAVFWQIYPLGFTGAEAAASDRAGVVHRLRHIKSWLDYAVELGASGLLLGPIFASSTHGYDTIDYFQIDPRLGDDADFDALIEAAHARGLRVVLDGVFNHVGREFPLFRRAVAAGPHAPDAAWFRLSWPADRAPGLEPEYETFEGHRQLVALNHDEPAVAHYVARVMNHWLERGADGWRLDAAYAVPRQFLAQVLPQVRTGHPDAYVFGEVIHGDYAGFVRDTGVDAVTQYELWKAIWSSLNDRNFFELAWALGRHNEILDGVMPQTFTGNHDVTRLASQIADDRHLGHALAVLMTVGGIPSIYYGDEQAFRGVKEERAGGDDEIRPAFPASPAELPPDGWPAYRLHQRLIGLRRRHPWLARARTTVEHLANETIAIRAAADDDGILLLLNAGDTPFRFPVEMTGLTVAEASDPDARPGDPALVPAHSWIILAS